MLTYIIAVWDSADSILIKERRGERKYMRTKKKKGQS